MGGPVGTSGVFITGTSSGIGAALAVHFAQAGYRVGGASRRGTVPELPADAPGEIVGIPLDVADPARAAVAIKDFAASCDRFAGVINNAGIHLTAPSADLDLDELRHVLEVNLISAVALAQLAFPLLKEAGGGFIANMGSFYADLGVPRNLAYSASKAALASVTRTLGVEWGKHGVSVVNFAPGYIETAFNAEYLQDDDNRAAMAKQIPVRRVGNVDELARLVVNVLTADCSFLTGATITIDGGQGIRL
ncbi:MAG TPA: SDR family oxidoreductase [Sporichthya sp.]|nr:SDR family oxidoreductase [Sporichthya sp.]